MNKIDTVTWAVREPLSDAELQELKDTVRGMQQTIEQLNKKIEKMEQERQTEKAAAPAPPGAHVHVNAARGAAASSQGKGGQSPQ